MNKEKKLRFGTQSIERCVTLVYLVGRLVRFKLHLKQNISKFAEIEIKLIIEREIISG